MKLNKKKTTASILAQHPSKTSNLAGGTAFTTDPLTTLYSYVCTNLVNEPKFYKEINDTVKKISDVPETAHLRNLINQAAEIDPEFILQLATYSRNHMNLRTISLVLLVESSLHPKCKKYVRQYTPSIVSRADELMEATAYLQNRIGHLGNKASKGSMPASLKKGLAESFDNFDEYHFAKYDRKGLVKLKDVVRLVHPKPRNAERALLYKRILTDELKTPNTWEVVISTKGSTPEQWESIAPKMPYMATLRNLRNFLDHNIPSLPSIAKKLSDPEAVLRSKQLPFRYLSAYREIQSHQNRHTSKILDALQSCLDVSCDNLPTLDGITLIVADNSGSMDSPLSTHSKVSLKDIANTLLCVMHKTCTDSITGVFADNFKTVNLSSRDGVLTNIEKVKQVYVGSGTYANTIFDYLLSKKVKVDRVILLSDMQCYEKSSPVFNIGNAPLASLVHKYRSSINPKMRFYSIDLAGYGTVQVPQDDPSTVLLAGWSERVLEYIQMFEENKSDIIKTIKLYQVPRNDVKD